MNLKTFLENLPVVLLDVVQVITTNRDCPIHFHLLDNTSQDAATDGDIAGEWALLVNISAINSLQTMVKNKVYSRYKIHYTCTQYLDYKPIYK